jgi:PAS domain S-box-containing protein
MDGGIAAFGPKADPSAQGPASPPPTLRGRLLLLVAAVAAPLLGLGAVSVWQGYTGERARAEARLLAQARSVALGVDQAAERTETVLRTLGNSSALARGDLAGFEAEMRATAASFGAPSIALMNVDGSFALSTRWAPEERRADSRGTELVPRVLASRRAELSDLLPSVLTGQPIVLMLAPVFGPAPEGAEQRPIAHLLGMPLDRERLRALLTDLRLPPRWNASVLDRSGTYVARLHNDREALGQRPAARTLAGLADAAEGIVSGGGHRTLEGVPVVTAFARAPRSGYAVLIGMPEEAFRAPLHAALLRSLGVGVAVTLAGLLLALLLSHRILAAVRGVLRPEGARRVRLREVDEVARLLRCAQAQRDRAEAAQRERAAQIEATYASAPVGLCLYDRELRWLAVNNRLAAIHGFPAAAHIGRTPRDLLPDLAGRIEPILRRVLETGEPVENREARATTPSQPGVPRDFLASYHPVRDAAGEVAGISVAVQEITDLRRATAALETSEARFHGMAEAVPSLLFEGDAEGGCSWVSAAWGAYAGVTVEQARGTGWVASLHPEDQPRVLLLWREAMSGGTEFEARFRIRRHDGDWRWHMVRARPQRDGGGRIARWLGAATDIHEVVQSEARLRLVAAELNHRVKNVLATVQSIAAQTSRAGKADPAGFVAEFNARLRSLGRAHELLTATFWEGARLDAVVRAALAPWLEPAEPGASPARLELRCGEAMPSLSPRQAQSVVLALHELATNAAKHGALSGPDGRVAVACRTTEDGLAVIAWRESGGPPILEPPRRSGFGTRVLQRALARDLGAGAAVELCFAPGGLRADIRFVPG